MQQLLRLWQMGWELIRVVMDQSVWGGGSSLHATEILNTHSHTHIHQIIPIGIKCSPNCPASWRGHTAPDPAVMGQRKPELRTCVCIPHSRHDRHSSRRDVWEWQEFLEAEGVDRNRTPMTWTHDICTDQRRSYAAWQQTLIDLWNLSLTGNRKVSELVLSSDMSC